MSNIPVIEKNYSYSVEVLLDLYYDYSTIRTKDLQDLYYISQIHASNILRRMWRKGWVERKLQFVKPRGRYYEYRMSEKGYNLLKWLDSKGVLKLK